MKLIIGRDKNDYVKGVRHKLASFEKFLKTYPEWIGKVYKLFHLIFIFIIFAIIILIFYYTCIINKKNIIIFISLINNKRLY